VDLIVVAEEALHALIAVKGVDDVKVVVGKIVCDPEEAARRKDVMIAGQASVREKLSGFIDIIIAVVFADDDAE